MNTAFVESSLESLRVALDAAQPEGVFLASGRVLEGLLNLCYEAEGLPLPPLEERFSRLPETKLGAEFFPNLEAYARVCRRLDGITAGRSADSYPQYSDGVRLLARLCQE